MDEELQRVRTFAERYVERSGLRLNPDEEELEVVLKGLAHNRARYGPQYCPCRPVTGNPTEDRPKICPCEWHEEEIEEEGHCHCRLFFEPSAQGL
ncbi:MAG: hypothetical protein MAG715_01068 [Methanonatronarchaeales archaeon]|nr:hypothetical protein [Methanonatronarchaeales archaeon]